LKIKRNADSDKVQYKFELGEQKFIQVSFGELEQTKLGGAPLLAKLESDIGLVSGAAAVLRDSRLRSQTKFPLAHLLWQRVLLICCGYEDACDGALLSHDPGLRLALLPQLQMELASQPTMSRFETSMSLANSYRLAVWLVLMYISSKKEVPESIRLDFDGSSCPTYGFQEGSSFRSYYQENMYFPLFVFDGDGVLITAILRPGEAGEARQTLAVLRRLTKVFREKWTAVSITVVMDAAFNDQRIYDWCEDNDIFYLIKLKNCGGKGSGLTSKSKSLAKLCKESFGSRFGVARYLAPKLESKRKKYSKSKSTVEKEIKSITDSRERKAALQELHTRIARRYGSFQHRTGKGGKDTKQWRQDRRVLVECTYDDWGARSTFWITNIQDTDEALLINEMYSKRGNAELRIKDAKAFRCDKMSCQSFRANQFRLLMHVLAQRLLYMYRELLPSGERKISLGTVKEHYICIPGIVKRFSSHTKLIWSDSHPYKKRMYALCERLSNSASRRAA